jgi:DNA-binding response OmpR family regulator
VRAFAHAPEALDALEQDAADLVITDGTNSPIDGIEFVRRLRTFSDTPVIFVSAWADEIEQKLRGTELEARDYIQVPFARANFVARVRQGS